jgi:hypothetical protein
MKNFLKTFGVILIILGTYLFVMNVINKGGYQILIGACDDEDILQVMGKNFIVPPKEPLVRS